MDGTESVDSGTTPLPSLDSSGAAATDASVSDAKPQADVMLGGTLLAAPPTMATMAGNWGGGSTVGVSAAGRGAYKRGPGEDGSRMQQFDDTRDNNSSDAASLKLRKLRNKCLRRWETDISSVGNGTGTFDSKANLNTSATSGGLDLVGMTIGGEAVSESTAKELETMKRNARDDVYEVWNAAADLERELFSLHNEVERLGALQDEFEEEKAAQQARIRELQEKLEQVEAFWKGRLRGAENELNETERRLLQTPAVGPAVPRTASASGAAELEERTTEIYDELVKTKEELSRLQKEKAELKGEVSELKAQLKNEAAAKDELTVTFKKYEALKVRAIALQNRVVQAENNTDVLTESLLENQAKNQELELLLEEHRDREKELNRHLEALREVHSTAVPQEVQGATQNYDLFAELQLAQNHQTLAPSIMSEDLQSGKETDDIDETDDIESPSEAAEEDPELDLTADEGLTAGEESVESLKKQPLGTTGPVTNIDIPKELNEMSPSATAQVDIPTERGGKDVLASHIQAALSILEKPVVQTQSGAAAVSIPKERPEITKSKPNTVVIEGDKAEELLKVVAGAAELKGDGRIHVHLHQHYHTHMHQHAHQHDHIHHCGCSSGERVDSTPGATTATQHVLRGSRPRPKEELTAIHRLMREGKLAHAEVAFSAGSKAAPAPAVVGSPADSDLRRVARPAPSAAGSTRLRPVMVDGVPKRVTRGILDNDGSGGSGSSPIGSGFIYTSTRFKGRETHHCTPPPSSPSPPRISVSVPVDESEVAESEAAKNFSTAFYEKRLEMQLGKSQGRAGAAPASATTTTTTTPEGTKDPSLVDYSPLSASTVSGTPAKV